MQLESLASLVLNAHSTDTCVGSGAHSDLYRRSCGTRSSPTSMVPADSDRKRTLVNSMFSISVEVAD